jgi:serine/threonine-protein kinase RsbW
MARAKVALDIIIPSDVAEIERVVELVQRECVAADVAAPKCAFNVRVAVTEALSNAILRGNQEYGKQVRVRASVREDAFIVDVVDEGAGFNLEAATVDPTTPENIEREDGRGLFLMRTLMDSVERFQNNGNVVRMTLHL